MYGLSARRLGQDPQDKEGVTYAAKITKAEARLDWSQPADVLARQVRAFVPFPGSFFEMPNSSERVKVLGAIAEASPPPRNTNRHCFLPP